MHGPNQALVMSNQWWTVFCDLGIIERSGANKNEARCERFGLAE
jgi:hypothetical protein